MCSIRSPRPHRWAYRFSNHVAPKLPCPHKLNRIHIPVQHTPFHSSKPHFGGLPDNFLEKNAPQTPSSIRLSHKKALYIKSWLCQKRRIISIKKPTIALSFPRAKTNKTLYGSFTVCLSLTFLTVCSTYSSRVLGVRKFLWDISRKIVGPWNGGALMRVDERASSVTMQWSMRCSNSVTVVTDAIGNVSCHLASLAGWAFVG